MGPYRRWVFVDVTGGYRVCDYGDIGYTPHFFYNRILWIFWSRKNNNNKPDRMQGKLSKISQFFSYVVILMEIPTLRASNIQKKKLLQVWGQSVGKFSSALPPILQKASWTPCIPLPPFINSSHPIHPVTVFALPFGVFLENI